MHTPESLLALLTEHRIAYNHVTHPAVITAHDNPLDTDGIPLRDKIPGAIVRNLFLRDKAPPETRGYWLITLPLLAPAVDLKALKPLLQQHGPVSGNLSFGSPEELYNLLGVTPGSVCPFAAINDVHHKVTAFVEESLLKQNLISAHPLINTATVSVTPAALMAFFRLSGHTPRIIPLPYRTEACPPANPVA